VNGPKLSLIRWLARLETVWNAATRPAQEIQPSDNYPIAALARVALLFVPLMALTTFVSLPLAIADLPNNVVTHQPMFYLGLGMIVASAVTYVLARTGHHRMGGALFVSALTVAIYLAAALGDIDVPGRIELLSWLAIGSLLGSFFLSARLTILFGVISVLGVLGFPIIHPDNTISTLIGVLTFVVITNVAIMSIKIQRERLERENIRLLVERQADLEARVRARTIELEQANERLALLGRARDEFLHSISHEIRTPITSIKLNHELLRVDPAKAETYLNRLERETSRLIHIVEPLLQMARTDMVSPSLEMGYVDLNVMLSQLAEDRQDYAHARSIQLRENLAARLPFARGDMMWIEQAASVILTNALNYTPPHGIVTLSTAQRSVDGVGWAGFAIADTGPGVPPDEREQIFERFFRGSVGRDSGVEGTGLGLAIVQQITAWHSGKVEVTSAEADGHGAIFSLWLPAAVP